MNNTLWHTTIKYSLLCSLLCLLPGCSTSWKRIKPDVQHHEVRASVEQRMGMHDTPQEFYNALRIEEQLSAGISRADVARIVLNNQFTVTPVLEVLGISKADLVQAGIYKNPYMQNTFNATPLDLPSSISTEISTEIDFSISDLWQLPKRKDVAQKDLTIKQLEVTSAILDNVIQVQRIYDSCLALQSKIDYAHQGLAFIEHLFKDAQRSKSPTIGEKATWHTVEATRTGWHLAIITYEQQLKLNSIALREILNINPSISPPILISELLYENQLLVDCVTLEQAALEHSYELAISKEKIEREKAVIKLEQSRFLDNFVVGYIFEKSAPNQSNSGLVVDLDLPIFDNNRTGVARARFSLAKAEKEFYISKRKILAKVRQLYTQLQTLQASIPLYQETISHYNQSLGVADTLPTMEVVYTLAVPNIYQNIFDTHILLLDSYVQARDTVRQLEALTGMSAYTIQSSQNIESPRAYEKPMLALNDLGLTALCTTHDVFLH